MEEKEKAFEKIFGAAFDAADRMMEERKKRT
jgi:hypothetical protein